MGTSLICDLSYPFLLAHVKKTERVLPDGTVVAGNSGLGQLGEADKKER